MMMVVESMELSGLIRANLRTTLDPNLSCFEMDLRCANLLLVGCLVFTTRHLTDVGIRGGYFNSLMYIFLN
jgi:hypothetical protein